MKKHICTYFDSNFFARGMALYDSLTKHGTDFQFYILCLDPITEKKLQALNFPNIVIFSLDAYKKHFAIDATRFQSDKELYFSLTAGYCLFVFNHNPDIDILLYLDADMYCYSSIDVLYDELGEKSIGIAKHNLPYWLKKFTKHYGTFNVGVNLFRNSEESFRCITHWKKQCDDWQPNSKDSPHPFFIDQIYLDDWPILYKDLVVFDHQGIDVAPWNVFNYKLLKEDNQYFVKKNKHLILYHFSSLRLLSLNRWHTDTARFCVNMTGTLKDLYLDYLDNVEKHLQAENIQFATLKNHDRSFIKNKIIKFFKFYFQEIIQTK